MLTHSNKSFKEYPDKNEIWQTLELYKSFKTNPDVFLGSSAVLSALDGADQLSKNARLIRKLHPNCALFEKQLRTLTNTRYRTFISAINGSVASDQCMILSAIRNMHHLPKTIIYEATARDFINNGLFCPDSTPVFQCLDIGNEYADAYSNKNDLLYSFLNEHLWLLRESHKFKNIIYILWRKLLRDFYVGDHLPLDQADPAVALKLESQNSDLVSMSKEKKAKYLLERKKFLRSDLMNYLATYTPFPKYAYAQQLRYLEKIISICKTAGTNLILVNMPTSRENMELLGTNAYGRYLSDVKTRISKSGYNFIDMNSLPDFSSGYFYDSVHLNPCGAKLFVIELAKKLANRTAPMLGGTKNDNEGQFILPVIFRLAKRICPD